MFIFETLYDDYQNDIERNKREKFNRLSSSDQKEYILNNPNSKIAREEEYEKEKEDKILYVDKKISEAKAPIPIKKLNIKTITHMSTKYYNQEVICYKWIKNNSDIEYGGDRYKEEIYEFNPLSDDYLRKDDLDKLSFEEIIEQLKLRYVKSSRLSSYTFNMSPEGASRRNFKIYNDYCFYEKPTSSGVYQSFVFDGELDNKIYENGKLISHKKGVFQGDDNKEQIINNLYKLSDRDVEELSIQLMKKDGLDIDQDDISPQEIGKYYALARGVLDQSKEENDFSIFKQTKLVSEVNLPIGYENIGIDHIYDGESFLKLNNGKPSLPIPLLFRDLSDDLHYILISVASLNNAKKIIDYIIDKNFGKKNFTILEDNHDFEYMFHNKFFSIGYMKSFSCVRINMLHNLKKI